MHSMLQDVRFAFRALKKSPTFAAVAIVTIALGIGANTVMFSVVNAVLLRPLPFRDSSRLAVLWERRLDRAELGSHGHGKNTVGPANFIRWREQNRTFETLAAGLFTASHMNLSGGPEPERVAVGVVSPNLFSVLGVSPVLGSGFVPDEEQPGKSHVVVLSRGYWRRRFAGDYGAIGRVLQLDGSPVTVVGVMPDYVKFPDAVDLWRPLELGPDARNARGRWMIVVGRLKPGVSMAQAQSDMDLVASNTRAELKDFDAEWGVRVVPLEEQIVGNVRTALYILLAAVGIMMLIACSNVANLLLARATLREREVAIRLALGARRRRIVAQLLTESVLLSGTGGVVGLALAYCSISPLLTIVPSDVPRFTPISINPEVLAFTAVAALLTGILFGLAPALRVSATSPQAALKEGARGAQDSRERRHLRNIIIVGETAIAVVLLAAGTLLLESFVRLRSVDPGFNPDNVVTLQVSPTGPRYQQPGITENYFEDAVARIRAVPGVISASAISFIPLDGLGSATDFLVDDHPTPKPEDRPGADIRVVTEGFFRTMQIPLLQGRDFSASLDHPDDSVLKVVINRTLAERLWPGQNPIGKRITMDWYTTLHAEVIGVAGDVRLQSLNDSVGNTLYWYLPQFPNDSMSFIVRTSGPPEQRLGDVRAQIVSVDRQQPIGKIRTMEEIIASSIKQPRFEISLLGGIAGLALVLVAVGIYGVISYTTTQRTHEIGVRVALGARPSDILRLVVGSGLRLTFSGILIGTAAALLANRALTKLLFNTRPTEPLAYVAAGTLLMVTALLASYFPARRASSVEPVEALRYE